MKMRHGFRGATVVVALFAVGCDNDDGEPNPTDTTDTADVADTADTADMADNNDSSDVVEAGFELIGNWTSDFGGYETITQTTWETFGDDDVLVFGQKVASFDNEANFAIVQNLPDAEFGANTYGRIVWTDIVDDSFAYCTVAFGHETAEAAADAPEAGIDRDDLEGGCSGFAWTSLTLK